MTDFGPRSAGRLHRRRLGLLAGAAAGAMAFGAPLARPGRRARAAQGAGELVIGAPQDRHLSGALVNIGMSIPNPNIFETLVTLTPEFAVMPGLATAWEPVGTNTFRFMLRDGVVFHDGTPFTAEAVAGTLARVAAAGGGVMAIVDDSVTIIDDLTVEITPGVENHRLPLQLAAPRTGSIFAPGTDVAVTRIGTGPYREVEYVPEQRYVVEAFADYWGGAPALSRLNFRFMPDPTTRLLALQAGEVAFIYDLAREAASELALTGHVLVQSGVGAYNALLFGIHGDAPYDLGQDPAIRAAVAQAIDRAALRDGAWLGLVEPNDTMVPPGLLGAAAAAVPPVAYDPAAAMAALDAAGWVPGADGVREKDGRRLHLTMVVGYPSADIHTPMPEFVQAQLATVGIELELVLTPDVGSYSGRLVAREGDLWAEVGNQADADPCYLLSGLFASPPPDADVESYQYPLAFAPGATVDGYIADCAAAEDVAGMQAAAAAALTYLITEEHIVIPLAGLPRLYGMTEQVQNFVAHPSQFVQRWDQVTLAE